MIATARLPSGSLSRSSSVAYTYQSASPHGPAIDIAEASKRATLATSAAASLTLRYSVVRMGLPHAPRVLSYWPALRMT